MTAKTYGPSDPEPEIGSGSLIVVHYGDYRRQEVWVASGANIGNWYPLGNEFTPGNISGVPAHPVWSDVVARGPVTLVAAGDDAGYRQGWRDGRKRFAVQVEELVEEEA